MEVWRLYLCFCTIDVMFADAIRAYSGGELTVTGPAATAGIFSTYPADYLSVWGGIVDQVGWSQILPSLPFDPLCQGMHVTVPVIPRDCSPGDRHSCTAAVCPGSWGSKEHLRP